MCGAVVSGLELGGLSNVFGPVRVEKGLIVKSSCSERVAVAARRTCWDRNYGRSRPVVVRRALGAWLSYSFASEL